MQEARQPGVDQPSDSERTARAQHERGPGHRAWRQRHSCVLDGDGRLQARLRRPADEEAAGALLPAVLRCWRVSVFMACGTADDARRLPPIGRAQRYAVWAPVRCGSWCRQVRPGAVAPGSAAIGGFGPVVSALGVRLSCGGLFDAAWRLIAAITTSIERPGGPCACPGHRTVAAACCPRDAAAAGVGASMPFTAMRLVAGSMWLSRVNARPLWLSRAASLPAQAMDRDAVGRSSDCRVRSRVARSRAPRIAERMAMLPRRRARAPMRCT